MTPQGLVWLGVATAIFVGGASALRLHIGDGRLAWLVAGLALYTLGNLCMVHVMRASGMAVAISMSAVVQLVVANLIAVSVFGERPSAAQVGGIVLGVLAICLILFPPGGRA